MHYKSWPSRSHAKALNRKEIYMHGLWEKAKEELQPNYAHEDTCWREELSV